MNEDNDITKEGAEAIMLFMRTFQQIIVASVKSELKDINNQVTNLSNQLSQAETKQKQTFFDLESVKFQIEKMASTSKLLENAGQTIELLGKQHYQQYIIEPLARSLFPVFDLISDANKHWKSSDQVIELLNVIWSQMAEFLAVYDIHVINHDAKDEFNPQTMKPVAWVPVNNKILDGSIAESLQTGFRFGNERMLRLETVSLFKYQPSETKLITLNERTEK